MWGILGSYYNIPKAIFYLEALHMSMYVVSITRHHDLPESLNPATFSCDYDRRPRLLGCRVFGWRLAAGRRSKAGAKSRACDWASGPIGVVLGYVDIIENEMDTTAVHWAQM